jgi:hypothetical protein
MNRLYNGDQEVVMRLHKLLAYAADVTRTTPDPHTCDQLAAFIETAFWASLELNEGRQTRFRATLAGPDQIPVAQRFENAVAYEESPIAKIAPAAPPGGCLGVSVFNNGFHIWGFGHGRSFSAQHVSVDVSQPGSLVVGIGELQPFAVLNGRKDPVLGGTRMDVPAHLQKVLGKAAGAVTEPLEAMVGFHECLTLVELVKAILHDGHGGTLLIVAGETGAWEKSLGFAHKFAKADTMIHEVILEENNAGHSQASAQIELSQYLSKIGAARERELVDALPLRRPLDFASMVRAAAPLAAVDGAVVITKDMGVIGFGAKITAQAACKVLMVQPVQTDEPQLPSEQLEVVGGTRHQSAARFVAANHDAVALVISQDRHVSIMEWEDRCNCVRVFRNAEWWL